MFSKRFYGAAMMAAVVIPSTLVGCGGDDNPLCCTEFKAGAQIEANIGGGAESQVAAQAVADFAGIASAALDDITAACRSMAQDLDATDADQSAAEGNADRRDRMKAWCTLAVKQIGAFKATAGGSITIAFQPPVCEASISAKANCQAKCSGSAECDIKANPPTCEGGKLEINCSGSCTAEASATVACQGSCDAACEGSCTAEGGVECAGECEGTCEGAGGAGTSGVTAEGKCEGTCKGTCKATKPGVTCTGSCNGSCSGSCKAEAGATVKCDGKCDGEFEPISCQGGELKGGCKVEAKCEGNCDASVKAKAECRPPAITITASGTANVQAFGRLKATLEANLGIVAAFRARLEGMVAVSASFTANIDAVADIKAACIPVLISAAGTAVEDVKASAEASGSIVGSVQ